MKPRVFSKPPRFAFAGLVLFEVMLAVVIVGLALTGFAVALSELVNASTAANHDAQLRAALQSRLAEIRTEHVLPGKSRYEYGGGKVLIDQTVAPADLRDSKGLPLAGIYEIALVVSPKQDKWPPMQGKMLIYQP